MKRKVLHNNLCKKIREPMHTFYLWGNTFFLRNCCKHWLLHVSGTYRPAFKPNMQSWTLEFLSVAFLCQTSASSRIWHSLTCAILTIALYKYTQQRSIHGHFNSHLGKQVQLFKFFFFALGSFCYKTLCDIRVWASETLILGRQILNVVVCTWKA